MQKLENFASSIPKKPREFSPSLGVLPRWSTAPRRSEETYIDVERADFTSQKDWEYHEAGFPKFRKLPGEIKNAIWEMAVALLL